MKVGGQLGNTNATKNKLWSEAIFKHAIQNPDKREKIVSKLYDMAIEGDIRAIKEIFDRVEGKASQPLCLSGDSYLADMPTEQLVELFNKLQAAK